MPEPESNILGAKWAARLGVALLLGLAGLVVFQIHEKSQRETLEQITEPTALGDTAFFHSPEKFDSSAVFAQFHGQPLYPTGTERLSLFDGKMLREGMDDGSVFHIYRSTERGGDCLFLKLARNQYLEVSRERMPE